MSVPFGLYDAECQIIFRGNKVALEVGVYIYESIGPLISLAFSFGNSESRRPLLLHSEEYIANEWMLKSISTGFDYSFHELILTFSKHLDRDDFIELYGDKNWEPKPPDLVVKAYHDIDLRLRAEGARLPDDYEEVFVRPLLDTMYL